MDNTGTPVVSLWVWGCIALQAGWLVWAIMNFIRRNDELPVVVAGFLAYCGSYRFLMVYFGGADWLVLGFNLGLSITWASASTALMLMTFGQTALLAGYRYWQNKTLWVQEQRLPEVVLTRLRKLLVYLTVLGIPLAIWTRHYVSVQMAEGKDLAFQVSSYVQQFPMVLVALAIFLFLAWRFGALHDLTEKIAAVFLLLIISWLTFGATGRFMFLGWILGGSYIVSTRWFGLNRIPVLLIGVLVALALFGVAGAMRNPDETTSLAKSGVARVESGEDANMLDGLVYLMQVYPQMLPYRYGGGHLEILERPIPRALWPGKPVGGYMNKLGVFDAESGLTVGISPTLFGSFYTEGGWVAVFLFSAAYAWVLARAVRYSSKLRPLFGILIRASLIAGLIPLLRGGDLAGIYAWLGMAFWPLLLFLWWNREALYSPGTQMPARNNQRRRRRGGRSGDGPALEVAPFSATLEEKVEIKKAES